MTEDSPSPQHNLITISEVCVQFPQQPSPVLDRISLQVKAGEMLAIIGPSGCGKSTLLRVLAGLLPPTTGNVTLASGSGHHPALSQPGQIAMVFQESRLLPWRTVLENMQLPFILTGQPVDHQRIEQLLEMTGLTRDDFRKKPPMLSGGMKMRVAVARALVLKPQLILLDEPFAAVDDLLREQLNEELLLLQKRFRFGAVLVTHHLAEAVYLSNRVLTMSSRPGRLQQEISIPWNSIRPPDLREAPEFTRLCSQIKKSLSFRAAAQSSSIDP